MRKADMKFEWFVDFRKSNSDMVQHVTGKASTHELADKGRKSWISHMNKMNSYVTDGGATNVLIDSGVKELA